MISEKWDEKVIELAKSLINCQSYSGHEDKAAEALKAYMKETGVFDEIETDCYGNVIGHIKGKNHGLKVLFDGHIDTVPVGNLKDWKHDPFHAVVEDGKLYGRGAADMKGAVAAFTVAAHRYAVENGKNFAGDVYVAGVVHEECFEGVAARKISEKVKQIFKEWKKKYKDIAFADTFLKVDYIVPPFPKSCWVYESYDRNYGKGYFLHIGANIDESISRANNCGIEMQQLLLATVSRYQWMDENNGSGNRDQFLDMYNKTGKYYLVPVGLKNPSMGVVIENMQFDFEYAIPMKEITVTAGTKITEENPCKAVLMEPEE